MSLRLVYKAAAIEQNDELHLARLLLLLLASGGKTRKPIQGITKLAKLDFLLRYPNALVRVMDKLGMKAKDRPDESETNTIEARMIRFRYGPWDARYRRWIGLLVAKGLASTYIEGRAVNVKLTEAGESLATNISHLDEFADLAIRSKSVVRAVGAYGSTRLKNFVYEVFPEITEMQWGARIDL